MYFSESKRFRLHYGGEWSSDAPSYTWIGGDHVDILCMRRECKNLLDIEEMFRKNCPIEDGRYNYSYMIGGLKFDINNDVEVKFLWSHMRTSSDSMHHVYCGKNREADIEGIQVDSSQVGVEESINPSDQPPTISSEEIDLGPPISFSTYFEDMSPTKVTSLIVSPKNKKGKKQLISKGQPKFIRPSKY